MRVRDEGRFKGIRMSFDLWQNRDECFLAWSDAVDALVERDETLPPAVAIVQATDSEASLRLYMVPKTEISEAVRGALQVLDQKRYSYRDCLHDPDLVAAGLRVLNALGLLDDGPGLLARVIDHFIQDIEHAFARARPRDREQVPEIIAKLEAMK